MLVGEMTLATSVGVLADADGIAEVAARLEGGNTVADSGGETRDLLHRPGNRHAHRTNCGVDAVGHVYCAVGHLIHLVQLPVHLVDAHADLGDHREQLLLRSPNKRGQALEGSGEPQKHVSESHSHGHEKEGQRVVRDVTGGQGEKRHVVILDDRCHDLARSDARSGESGPLPDYLIGLTADQPARPLRVLSPSPMQPASATA